MPALTDLGTFFSTLKEVDLNAISRAAEEPCHIALIGRPGVGKSTLATALRLDVKTGTASLAAGLSEHSLPLTAEDQKRLAQVRVVVLLLDATSKDYALERAAFDAWVQKKTPMVVVYNKADLVADARDLVSGAGDWMPAPVVAISALDRGAIERNLVPVLLRVGAVKERLIAVARALPLMRAVAVRQLIDEAAFINATYSFTTGLAEIVPVFDIPFNVADMIILTKNQALMAFKIALATGMSSDWRETLPQLATVIGAGFMWRQLGRSLIGLIPAWGLVPKVAIAYGGTIAVGEAIAHWRDTGEKLKPALMGETYARAFEQGKAFATTLVERMKRPGQKEPKALPAPAKPRAGHCANCGKRVPRGAGWCPHCGQAQKAPLALPSADHDIIANDETPGGSST